MATFAELKTDIAKWLNREGMTEITDMSGDFLDFAQRRIFRDCDLRAMEATHSTTSDTLTLPADFLRTKQLYYVSDSCYVPIKGSSFNNVLHAKSTTAAPRFYTIVGDSLFLGPEPDQVYNLTLVYYKPLTLLSDANTTNWLSTNVPELLLYGALVEASFYLKDDQRASVWLAKFGECYKSLKENEERQDYEGGSLQVQFN